MDDLQCEICANWYNEEDRRPKNLPCGHSYCSSCMTKELTLGRRSCPTCRRPHNATSIADLPTSVTLERLIRNMPKKSSLKTMSSDSEDEDYSGGPCPKHKKSLTYFYCLTHSQQICRECTVIHHPVSKCDIVSFEEQVETKKDKDVSQASSTRKEIDEKLAALGELIKETQETISVQEDKILQWKRSVEDATKIIAQKKTTNENAKREIANGQINRTNIDAAKQRLMKAKTKKSIEMCSIDVVNLQANIAKWMQDLDTKFKVPVVKVKSPTRAATLNMIANRVKSSAPADILKDIENGKVVFAETIINSRTAYASLSSSNNKLHVHTYKFEALQRGALSVQYGQLLGHVRNSPLSFMQLYARQNQPTLLFIDLKHRETPLGRVYIRIRPELDTFIKHIPALFTGENGYSILGQNGAGCAIFHLGLHVDQHVKDISSRKTGSCSTKYGEVVCAFLSDKIYRIFIFTQQWSTTDHGSNYSKIGSVENGLDVAVKAKGVGGNAQDNISITDCGLVIEM